MYHGVLAAALSVPLTFSTKAIRPPPTNTDNIVFHDATHLSTIGHIVAQHNRIILSTTRGRMFGNTPDDVNLTIGFLNFEGGQTVPAPPEVSKLVYGVYDPENRLRGSVTWHEPWGMGVFPVLGAEKYNIKKY